METDDCDPPRTQKAPCKVLEDFSVPSLRNVGEVIVVKGRVIRLTKDLLVEKRRTYVCNSCKAIADGFSSYEQYYKMIVPRCPNRRTKDCTGFMRLATKQPQSGDLMKFQELMLQEIDTRVTIPRVFKATLEGPLIDTCGTGDCVEVTGTVEVRFNPGNNSRPEPNLALRCQEVKNLEGNRYAPDYEAEMGKARRKWYRLAKEHGELRARDLLLRSTFTEVKGLEYVKFSLLLLLTGTAERISADDSNTRCQSHILLIGDRATAKTRLLRGVTHYQSPSLFANGTGCSAAGLTAACIKSGAHWTLQAGVLVICDGGVCCIDEFNLLKPADQAICHEPMEQQTFSIAKAGIHSRMNTRCSIVAGISLKKSSMTHDVTTQSCGLSTSLASRFDLILATCDERNIKWDNEFTDFILGTGNVERDVPTFTDDEVKAHLYLARSLKPVFSEESVAIFNAYYDICRYDEFRDLSRTTPRLRDGLTRLGYAHAKLCCRTTVNTVDAVMAVLLVDSSVGFGRVVSPKLNLNRSQLPLEPSKESILRVLKRLQVDEGVFKEEQLNCGPKVELTDQDLLVMDEEEEEEREEGDKKLNEKEQGICESKEESVCRVEEPPKVKLTVKQAMQNFIDKMKSRREEATKKELSSSNSMIVTDNAKEGCSKSVVVEEKDIATKDNEVETPVTDLPTEKTPVDEVEDQSSLAMFIRGLEEHDSSPDTIAAEQSLAAPTPEDSEESEEEDYQMSQLSLNSFMGQVDWDPVEKRFTKKSATAKEVPDVDQFNDNVVEALLSRFKEDLPQQNQSTQLPASVLPIKVISEKQTLGETKDANNSAIMAEPRIIISSDFDFLIAEMAREDRREREARASVVPPQEFQAPALPPHEDQPMPEVDVPQPSPANVRAPIEVISKKPTRCLTEELNNSEIMEEPKILISSDFDFLIAAMKREDQLRARRERLLKKVQAPVAPPPDEDEAMPQVEGEIVVEPPTATEIASTASGSAQVEENPGAIPSSTQPLPNIFSMLDFSVLDEIPERLFDDDGKFIFPVKFGAPKKTTEPNYRKTDEWLKNSLE